MQLLSNPEDARRVADRIVRCVAESFDGEKPSGLIIVPGTAPKKAEIKRRTERCYEWLLILKSDCGYGTERALDEMGNALRAELRGEKYEPPRPTRSWGAGAPRLMEGEAPAQPSENIRIGDGS